jgi:hypothetical protein
MSLRDGRFDQLPMLFNTVRMRLRWILDIGAAVSTGTAAWKQLCDGCKARAGQLIEAMGKTAQKNSQWLRAAVESGNQCSTNAL